jgi:Concanavalin A-like lectin/glucanases superfamily
VAGEPAFQSVFTSRWVFESNTPEQQCFGFTLYAGDDDHWQFWTGNGRQGEIWDQLRSTTKVDRERWTHVVATFVPTGKQTESVVEGTVCIYANGKRIADGVHEISRTDFEWPARIGAAEFVPKNLTSWLFKGHLRDVAIYDYPLNAEAIEVHRRSGQSAQDHLLSLRDWLRERVATVTKES